MDSYDHYATADLTEKYTQLLEGSPGGGPAPTATIGAFGRRSTSGLRCISGGSSLNFTAKFPAFVLTATGAIVVVGFAWKQANSTYGALQVGTNVDDLSDNSAVCSNALVVIRQGSVTQGFLRVNTNGTLSYVRGPGASQTVLGTTALALALGTTYYIELKVEISNTVGTVDIHVDGAPWLALTTQDTQATASATWNELWLNKPSGVTIQWDWDDLYVCDGSGAAPWNTFLGDCRVDALYPTGAGATTGWTPSAGANWQCVDDTAPNDDTDYTTASSAGLVDTFVVSDAPVPGAAIYGVQHCLSAKKTDAGTATIAPVIRHSGVDYVGADLFPGTGYTYARVIDVLNPGTAAAWTEAGFNAAEFGVKRTT